MKFDLTRKFCAAILVFAIYACDSLKSGTADNAGPIDFERIEQDDSEEPIIELAAESESDSTGVNKYLSSDTIRRLGRPIFRNLKVDTAQLFGVWANEQTSPNAAFSIDKYKYYIADFDGDPVVPYILDGDSLTLFFNWGRQKSRLSQPTQDILIMSNASGQNIVYERFKD